MDISVGMRVSVGVDVNVGVSGRERGHEPIRSPCEAQRNSGGAKEESHEKAMRST